MRCDEMNTLKTVTPDGSMKSKDVVFYCGGKSNFGYDVAEGYYFLDSYDECDGTCFIAIKLDHIPKKPQKQIGFFTYGVSLDTLTSLEDMFGDVITKAREELDEVTLMSIINQLPNCEFKQNTFKTLNTVIKKNK